jgi:hypothetical protein
MNDEIITKLKSPEFTKRFVFQARLTLQVYLDLKLLKEWKFIELHENNRIEMCYLSGMKGETVNFLLISF